MAMPIRTTYEDASATVKYLATKPTGVSVADAKKVVSAKLMDGRKLAAYAYWGLIEKEEGGHLRLTERGRALANASEAASQDVMADVIRDTTTYRAVIEREQQQGQGAVSALDVAAYWHEHFTNEASESDKILNDQAICFFHVVQAAGLGTLVIGRRGAPTRFEFDGARVNAFVSGATADPSPALPEEDEEPSVEEEGDAGDAVQPDPNASSEVQLFIAHGRNTKPLDQVKAILDEIGIKYVVAIDEPNAGRPISQKVADLMKASTGGIFIFTGDDEFFDKDGNSILRPRENVIYELGAASLQFGRRIVILKEEEVTFPSDFSDLGYIPFPKDQLAEQTMRLFSELRAIGAVKIVAA